MLTPLTEKEQRLIVKNVVASCNKGIHKLNKRGYSFLCLCSGFITYYNLNGFQYHYACNSLKEDLVQNTYMNQWYNFHPGEEDYEYHLAKRNVYNEILKHI